MGEILGVVVFVRVEVGRIWVVRLLVESLMFYGIECRFWRLVLPWNLKCSFDFADGCGFCFSVWVLLL